VLSREEIHENRDTGQRLAQRLMQLMADLPLLTLRGLDEKTVK
jgi:hypothetical protein